MVAWPDLGSQHGGVGRGLVTVSLHLHAAGHPEEGWVEGEGIEVRRRLDRLGEKEKCEQVEGEEEQEGRGTE